MAAQKEQLTPEQQIEALKKQLADQAAESAAKDAIIEGQAEQLLVAEAQAEEGRIVISHEGQQYRVLVQQLDVDGETVSAADLKTKSNVVATLLKRKSGALQLLEK